jgi:MOSC domain-containing protein YiiM
MSDLHLGLPDLEEGLLEIRRSPADRGKLELIVRRPQTEVREVLVEGELDLREGLLGDNYFARGSSMTGDGSAHPEMQITIMNARTIALVARTKERWQLAGDQLFVDMDLSHDNLPAGSRVRIGSAVLEVTSPPHNGCKKFAGRFGQDAARFVNSVEGKRLRLRGVNTKVASEGTIRVGDVVEKM